MTLPIVSFYCDTDGGNFYANCARRLKQQCAKLKIPCYIKNMKFGSTWIDNVRAKPKFMLRMLTQLNTPIIWLDIDTQLLASPTKAEKLLKHSDWVIATKNRDDRVWFWGHFYGVANTPAATALLGAWAQACDERPNSGDHTTLVAVLARPQHADLRIKCLSTEYVSGPVCRVGRSKSKSKRAFYRGRLGKR